MEYGNIHDDVAYGSSLPLVRLNLILPFVQALDRLQVDADAVLAKYGYARASVHDLNMLVPVAIIHRFLEDAAGVANDPYLGVHVGETLEPARWTPLVDAATHATSLGGFLIRFIRTARNEANSAYHMLEIRPHHAFFKEVRTTEQEIAPAQNDAFMAALILGLLRRGAGAGWNAADVWLQVCDPRALPERYLGIHIVGGDRMGFVVRFPSEWLLQPLDRYALLQLSGYDQKRVDLPTDFLTALRQVLALNLRNPRLNVTYAAQLTGISRQSLQRKLKASGTTFSTEIIELKKRRAVEELVNSDKSVAEIGESLGFDDPNSFTRAFGSWTGKSPRQYRKHHRAR